jgi:phosphinothricin acetyltransferase
MDKMKVEIRPARHDDLEQINRIYNYYVLGSTCTYQIDPESMESRIEWFQTRFNRYPVFVACDSSQIVDIMFKSRF